MKSLRARLDEIDRPRDRKRRSRPSGGADGPMVWLYRQGGLSGAWYEVKSPFEDLDDEDVVVGLWDLGDDERIWEAVTVVVARELIR